VSRILAIDPGTTQSAWVLLTGQYIHPTNFGILDNNELVDRLPGWALQATTVVVEEVRSYGMPVGREVFDTCRWTGRFQQAALAATEVGFIGRKDVVTHLCGSAKAKDANVRQALIDRFGGPSAIRKGGALYGIHKDVWAALAVAVAYSDGVR
jgi:hypothetical protein